MYLTGTLGVRIASLRLVKLSILRTGSFDHVSKMHGCLITGKLSVITSKYPDGLLFQILNLKTKSKVIPAAQDVPIVT